MVGNVGKVLVYGAGKALGLGFWKSVGLEFWDLAWDFEKYWFRVWGRPRLRMLPNKTCWFKSLGNPRFRILEMC